MLDDEEQMTFYSDLVNDWLSYVKGIGHNSDQHVQKMDDHSKGCDEKDEI